MGKKIDAFVLTLAAAGGFYFYFRNAFQNRVVAFVLALFCCFVLKKLVRRIGALLAKGRFLQNDLLERNML